MKNIPQHIIVPVNYSIENGVAYDLEYMTEVFNKAINNLPTPNSILP